MANKNKGFLGNLKDRFFPSKETPKNEGFEIPIHKEFESASLRDQKIIVYTFNLFNDLGDVTFDKNDAVVIPKNHPSDPYPTDVLILDELNSLAKGLREHNTLDGDTPEFSDHYKSQAELLILTPKLMDIPLNFDRPYNMQNQWTAENRLPDREEAIGAKILFLANDAGNPEKQKETLALNFSGSSEPLNLNRLKQSQEEIVKALDEWIIVSKEFEKSPETTNFWSSLKDQVKNLSLEKTKENPSPLSNIPHLQANRTAKTKPIDAKITAPWTEKDTEAFLDREKKLAKFSQQHGGTFKKQKLREETKDLTAKAKYHRQQDPALDKQLNEATKSIKKEMDRGRGR